MPTLKDVAERAGVSTATVSYVLNNRSGKVSEEVSERVRRVVKEMNYQPNMLAKALRSSRSNLIGVVVEDIATYQGSLLVKGINRYAGEHGYHLVLYDLGLMDKIRGNYGEIFDFQEEVQSTLSIFRSAGANGVIFVGTHDRDLTGLIRDKDSVVYAYSYSREEKDYMVGYDNYEITRQVVGKMIRKGHRRIGLISGPVDSAPTYQRLMGYQAALMEEEIPLDPSLIVSGNWSLVSGREACRKLLAKKEPPTALFSMNDWMALGAMKELRSCGYRVPEEMELVGFDDSDIAYSSDPELSSIRIPLEEIGQKAAELAIRLIEKRADSVRKYELPCRLIQRGTFTCS
ncbi:MAG: LacI family DNA-binding transcriptional regulator [Eubacteriales bacterium]|nr:LacI family DNA-binding transcriptional regulator [Eubacteriales bacterium]